MHTFCSGVNISDTKDHCQTEVSGLPVMGALQPTGYLKWTGCVNNPLFSSQVKGEQQSERRLDSKQNLQHQ